MAKTPTKTKKNTKVGVEQAEERKVKRAFSIYESFRLSKRIKGDALPGVFRLLKDSFVMLGRHWKLFLSFALLYGFFNALLVRASGAASNLSQAKLTYDQLFAGDWAQLASGLSTFVYMLGTSASSSSSSPTSGIYQLLLVLIISLALIWVLRQLYAGHKVRLRDGLYRGMTPLIQFTLVLFVVVLQLLPMTIGLVVYTAVTGNGIAPTLVERILWALPAFGLSLLSLYMVSSSLFALYIAALPDMTPMTALRSARQLVANRRWAVLRKVIFLPIALLLLAALMVVPVILFATPLAPYLFFALTLPLLPIVHSYMYTLYRSML